MHAGRGDRNVGNVVDALGGLQNGVNQDRFLDRVLRFQLGQELVEIMNIPRPFDFGQHDDIELLSHRAHDLGHVVEHPRRVECVDASPQASCAELVRFGQRDEACARLLLGVGRDSIFEVAEYHVDLCDQLRHFRA